MRTAHDRLVFLVVGGLLLLASAALGILGALALRSAEPSDLLLGALISLLSGATGALTAVLTQTGRSTPAVQDVHVTNNAADAVPTDPQQVGG